MEKSGRRYRTRRTGSRSAALIRLRIRHILRTSLILHPFHRKGRVLEPTDPKSSLDTSSPRPAQSNARSSSLRRQPCTVLPIKRAFWTSPKHLRPGPVEHLKRADFYSRRPSSYDQYRPHGFFTTGTTMNMLAVAVFGDHRVLLPIGSIR